VRKLLLPTLIISIFVLLTNIHISAQSQSIDSLEVKNEIINVVENSNGTFTINYLYSIKNIGEHPVKEIKIQNNLQQSFRNLQFQVQSLTSSRLNVNPSFNGRTVIDALYGENVLQADETATIYATVRLDPQDEEGPFENFIIVDGIVDGPDSENNSTSGGTSGGGQTPAPVQPEYPEDLNSAQRNIRFTLINADTDREIGPLNEGDVINLETLPTKNINIRAYVSPDTIGSLLFSLNGQGYKTENNGPYLLGGNSGTDYGVWKYTPGQQKLKATVYSKKYAKGSVQGERTINFTIVGKGPDWGGESEEGEEEAPEENGSGQTTGSGQNTGTTGGSGSSTRIDYLTSGQAGIAFSLIKKEEEKPEFVIEEPSKEFPGSVKGETEIRILPVSMNESATVLSSNVTRGNVLGETTLVETGLNLSDSLIIGMLLFLVIIELNVYELEDRFMHHITHFFKKRKQKLHTRL